MIHYLFLGLWLFWLVYWIARSVGNKRTTTEVNPAWRIATLLCAVALIWGLRNFPEYFRRRLVPPNDTRAWIGLALTGAGIAFTIWARNALGRNWSSAPVIKEGQELIQSGPYALVRHPIYTGLLLAVFGNGLARASIWWVHAFVATFLLFFWKIRLEEALMQRQFLEAYPAYRAKTKALIPFLF
ncbi:MAG TPA: isoprenylcysteine carboxylmethyltransferase family protein [Opitutaceae bacterium]|jgi:protein-S-isoprenylcysteine O-methyltransferase Ste14